MGNPVAYTNPSQISLTAQPRLRREAIDSDRAPSHARPPNRLTPRILLSDLRFPVAREIQPPCQALATSIPAFHFREFDDNTAKLQVFVIAASARALTIPPRPTALTPKCGMSERTERTNTTADIGAAQ